MICEGISALVVVEYLCTHVLLCCLHASESRGVVTIMMIVVAVVDGLI